MYREIAQHSAQLDRTLRPAVIETPLQRRPEFDTDSTEVWAKLENRQPTGSFKIRGATAKINSLSAAERARGVIAASTGNHGAAVALAASHRSVAAKVFVARGADPGKVGKIEALGAVIEVVDGDPVVAELAAREAAAASGAAYISPYNDATVVAGQGTIAVELLRQLPNLAGVVVAVGGGGLIAGVAATLRVHLPAARVIAASAANSAAMHHAVAAGSIHEVDHEPTLSDGTAGGVETGSVTFPLCRQLVDEWHLVGEAAIAAAMLRYMDSNDELIEGSAGLALAAVPLADIAGPVAVVICGGNVTAATLDSLEPLPS